MITIAVIGAGQRGKDLYAEYVVNHLDDVKVVGVAEPIKERREYMRVKHHIEDQYVFHSWDELLAVDKFCDAVLICTNDDLHYEPTKVALEKGYHVLLEKPMTNRLEEVDKLEELAKQHPNQVFMICHVLRYTPFFSTIKELLNKGVIGELMSIQHNENIGYWHMGHSFVRGNWRRSDETSPIILAKSCHDFDILNYLVGSKCTYVSSFGSLKHFKKECQPSKASERCFDCSIEAECPYSAYKLYHRYRGTWPATVISEEQSVEAIEKALKEGPYGRCVYACDNNVADHQVTILEYENGVNVTFNMCAFTEEMNRTIKLMGSHGDIRAHMGLNTIELNVFGKASQQISMEDVTGHIGHGGGDVRLLDDFISAIKDYSQGKEHEAKTTALASLESHRMAFAAEESRLTHRTISLK